MAGRKRKNEVATVENEQKLGRGCKEETLLRWHEVASLHVLRGMSPAAAYRRVYGVSDGSYASVLFKKPGFVEIVERLRFASALDDDSVRKNIEALYLQTVTDPAENVKNKLAAASQWQKLRGLESRKVEITNKVDEFILEQLKKCEEAMTMQAEIRAAKGRKLRDDALPPVEIEAEIQSPLE